MVRVNKKGTGEADHAAAPVPAFARIILRAGEGIRTLDPFLGKEVLYH